MGSTKKSRIKLLMTHDISFDCTKLWNLRSVRQTQDIHAQRERVGTFGHERLKGTVNLHSYFSLSLCPISFLSFFFFSDNGKSRQRAKRMQSISHLKSFPTFRVEVGQSRVAAEGYAVLFCVHVSLAAHPYSYFIRGGRGRGQLQS